MSIKKKLHHLVSGQLPDFVRAEYPQFVTFLEEYYKFLETEGEVHEVFLNSSDWNDIDLTINAFLPYYRAQYASDIPSNTLVDNRRLIKYINEYYEGKGSETSTEIFFRIMFNDTARVTYPGDYILRASDGRWQRKKFIKVENTQFSGEDIYELSGQVITLRYLEFISGVGTIERTTTTRCSNVYQTARPNIYQLEVDINPDYVFPDYISVDLSLAPSLGKDDTHVYIQLDGTTYGTITKQLISVESITLPGNNFFPDDAYVLSETGVEGPYFIGEENNAVIRVSETEDLPHEEYFAEDYVSEDYVSAADTGRILSLEIVDTGERFFARDNDGNPVNSFTIAIDAIRPGGASARITFNTGYIYEAPGEFKDNAGFLSDIVNLQDNNYYQPYSYVIETTIPLSSWKDIYLNSTHPAGFRMFAELLLSDSITETVTITDAISQVPFTIVDLSDESVTVDDTAGFEITFLAEKSDTVTVDDTDVAKALSTSASDSVTVDDTDFGFAFHTTWQTTGASEDITLPLVSDGTYNFEVDWGDGSSDTITAYDQAEVTHTYASAGTYDVVILGQIEGWDMFPLRLTMGPKLQTIESYGPLVLTTSRAFFGCTNMTSDATDAPTINTTNLASTFRNCSSFNGNVNNWDISGVTNLSNMFNGCSVFNQPLNNWDVSSVTTLSFMFRDCTDFNQSLNDWDTSSVTAMRNLFFNATTFNQPLNNWDTSSVTDMRYSFYSQNPFDPSVDPMSFDQDLGDWDVSSLTDATEMFYGAQLSTSNYDSLLIGWAAQTVQPNVPFHGGDSTYGEGATARETLTDAPNSWVITDGGHVVLTLYASGEQGAWYDPGDFTVMYQDSAGTTPVTALGQPVGLMLDKSQGAVVSGTELVTNGTFDSGITGWTDSSAGSASISWNAAGYIDLNGAADGRALAVQAITTTAGTSYRVNVDGVAAVPFSIVVGTSAGGNQLYSGTDGIGDKTAVFVATGTTSYITLRSRQVAETASADNISVREIPGNHASQSTSTARPTVQARVNLLERSQEIGVSPWSLSQVSVTLNAATAPDGTTTATEVVATGTDPYVQKSENSTALTHTFSIWVKGTGSTVGKTGVLRLVRDIYAETKTSPSFTITDEWVRHEYTATFSTAPTSVYGRIDAPDPAVASDTVYLWGAQLEQGSAATTYQRVTTATDYADVGAPRYLQFDGVDDTMSTASVDFTGTDKMTVIAGMEPEVGDKMAFELSPNLNTNNGSFYMYLTSSSYSFASRGTIADAITPGGITYPTKNVVTGLGDISAPSAILRVDQSQSVSSTTQGTGNYGNHSFYIGVRATSSLYFNGKIHQLIIRGATTSGTNLDDIENYVAFKTGITL